MKSILNKISLFIIALFVVSCTDVIDVDVPDGGDRLVVEADILWEKGTSGQEQTITLRTSTPYFSENEKTPITGAIVSVTKDNDGTIFSFADQNDGTYVTNDFVPVLNQTYTLEIDWEGKVYTAQETLISVPEITGVVQNEEGGFSGTETVVEIFFDDPADVENYYLADFFASNRPIKTLDAFSDQFSDGQEVSLEYESEGEIEQGVIIDYTLHGISERFHNYIEILIEQSGGDGGPFQSTPVQLKGNCSNIGDSSEEVLGYFRLSEVVSGRYEIQ